MPKRPINLCTTLTPPLKRNNSPILLNNTQNLWDEFNNIKSNILISATQISNYLMHDPIIDFFNINKGKGNSQLSQNSQKNNNKINKFTNYLFSKGETFENNQVEEIKQKFPNETITIYNNTNRVNLRFKTNLLQYYKLTCNAIKKNIPIIFQGVLFNENNNTFGVSDIIIKYNYINKLFPKFNSNINMNNLNQYRIIDFKFSSISYCSNNNNIINSGRYKAYKGQLAIYNAALGLVQKNTPDEAYIVDKNLNIGCIDYRNYDNKIIKKTIDAIKWCNNIHTYKISNLNDTDLVIETIKKNPANLFPNMNVDSYNNEYNCLKKIIAEKIGELTLLWNVSHKHRNNALLHNITSYKDINCTAQMLGINSKTGKLIDKIIYHNNALSDNYPVIFNNQLTNILNNKTQIDYYIDFETISDALYNNSNDNITFMICILFEYNMVDDELSKKYNYKRFNVDKTCSIIFKMDKYVIKDEIKLFLDMINFINTRKELLKINGKNNIYFWSNAEIVFFNNAFKKYDNYNELKKIFIDNSNWIDIYKIFIDKQITIKGCLNYKLKTISTVLMNSNLIPKLDFDDEINNGLNAMLYAIKYYKYIDSCNGNNNDDNTTKHDGLDIIEKYNELDCLLIYNITQFIMRISEENQKTK